MALTIEDGTGIAGADSWITEAECTTLLGKKFETVPTDWSGATAGAQEVALRNSAAYICEQYGTRVAGSDFVANDQGLCLPLKSACDVYGISFAYEIPEAFKMAQALIAAEIIGGSFDLFKNAAAKTPGDPDANPGSTFMSEDTVKIGDITISEKFSDSSSGGGRYDLEGEAAFPEIDSLLRRYLNAAGEGQSQIFFG